MRRLSQAGVPGAELEEAIAATMKAEEEADFEYLHENVPKALDRCLDGLVRISTVP
jgi:hypothetical protein